jgi:hypothetical protein
LHAHAIFILALTSQTKCGKKKKIWQNKKQHFFSKYLTGEKRFVFQPDLPLPDSSRKKNRLQIFIFHVFQCFFK